MIIDRLLISLHSRPVWIVWLSLAIKSIDLADDKIYSFSTPNKYLMCSQKIHIELNCNTLSPIILTI